MQNRLSEIESSQSFKGVSMVDQHEAIRLHINDPMEIDLELFKALPLFEGNKDQYRSWKSQVWTFMDGIKGFTNHPRYYSALGIVRTKITGAAADILTNHNTKMNFYSIINRLDYTFADQRPLYVHLEEMKKIVQGRKTLAEFHSEVSKALNLALSKIEMSENQNSGSMKDYANQEAVRTFIVGLNSKYTSGTLYSHNPKDLETAHAVATIYHDNVNRQFEIHSNLPRRNEQQRFHQPDDKRKYNPRFSEGQVYSHREDRQHHQYRPNVRVQRKYQPQQQLAPELMEVDSSQQYQRPTYYFNQHQK